MKQRSILLTMLLLMVGVSMQAQSVSDKQMDERFNDNKLPYGWYTEGWEVDSTGVAQKKSSSFDMEHFDISKLMGDDDSYNYLMTPPLSVKSGEVLSFSAKKGEGGNSGLGSFMGFIYDKHIIVRLEYCRILIKLATSHFCSTKVLHGSKVNIMGIRAFLGTLLENTK